MPANPIYKKHFKEFEDLCDKSSQLEAARIIKKKYNLDIKNLNAIVKGFKRLESKSETQNYDDEEVIHTDKFKEYCIEEGIDISRVRSAKYVNHGGQQKFNIVLDYSETAASEIDFDSIIKKYIKPLSYKPSAIKSNYLFDRLVYTDVHIGMDVNPNGFSLYDGKWDEEEVELRLNKIIAHVLEFKKSNTLVIDDLGDFTDGWGGETSRGGHDLPQNMDNEKAFDVGLAFKLKLTESLAKNYDKIIIHNVCNSNHSGSGFDYVVNSAYKKISEVMFHNVEVDNYRKFIEHYNIGKHYFVICHGKDYKNLKFGFKPKLDPVQIEKIKNYIDHHNIPRDAIIEFSKGDSHQYLFDASTSNTFSYCNYPAMSPASDWVKTNYKEGISGVIFFNYRGRGRIINELIF